ncbi:TRM11 family SAM-dependent methyltransferase [Massilia orientalis]|uniref:TRM11 family methyltransferase n=1 Tax=Massilia orientalis TaxID=3050128 RepID=A0ACC7MDS8_9BURK|nr:class I SAM-dependent methyltransferase [Massilia sp. YIM B02787]
MSRTKELGQYPTHQWAADAIVESFFRDLGVGSLVLEPSCGPGAFLAAVPAGVEAIGVDIDPVMAERARLNTGCRVLVGDFRTIELDFEPTHIIGNPPFNLKLIDGFLERAYELLPQGGHAGFILPAYAFQTAARVAGYADRWALSQSMIPRNLFPGLSLPLVFATFSKEQRRTLIGFALYRETAAVQKLPAAYREILAAVGGSVWARVIRLAVERLGGEADLQEIYREIEGRRPTSTPFWREQIRKVIRTPAAGCAQVARGRYALVPATNDAARVLAA